MNFMEQVRRAIFGPPKRRRPAKRKHNGKHIHRHGVMRRWDVFFTDERGRRKHHKPVKANSKGAAMVKAKRLATAFGGSTLSRVEVEGW